MADTDPTWRVFRGGPDLSKWTYPTPTVVITHGGYEVAFCFAGEDDIYGEGPLGKIEMLPGSEPLEPRHLRQVARHADLYLAYARAAMRSWHPDEQVARQEEMREAAEILRQVGGPGRGLSDEFYRQVAAEHRAIVDGGEPHPIKALGEAHQVTIGAASRWVKEAKRLGYIEDRTERAA